MALWIILGWIVIVAIGPIVRHNRFVSQRNLIRDRWRISHGTPPTIRPHPEPRRDGQGLRLAEREAFDQVARTRSGRGATRKPAAQAQPKVLTAALANCSPSVRPTRMKANQVFLLLQTELSNTEDRLQTSRRFYNANVRDLNKRIGQFPVGDRQDVPVQEREVLRILERDSRGRRNEGRLLDTGRRNGGAAGRRPHRRSRNTPPAPPAPPAGATFDLLRPLCPGAGRLWRQRRRNQRPSSLEK